MPTSGIPQPCDTDVEASTTWEYRRVKIGPLAHRASTAAEPGKAGRRYFLRLARRNPRQPLSVTIKYRGGSECWVEIVARGGVLRVPGHAAVYDVLMTLNSYKQ